MPRETGFDLLKIHVIAVSQHLVEHVPVTIVLMLVHDDVLAGDEIEQVLLRFRAECLVESGASMPGDGPVLCVAAIEDDNGIAVVDPCHVAGVRVRDRLRAESPEKEDENCRFIRGANLQINFLADSLLILYMDNRSNAPAEISAIVQ